MDLTPLHDRILVLADKAESVRPSGIYIPELAREASQQGEIIAIGDGTYSESLQRKIPLTVNIGDRILYGKYAGTEIQIGEIDYLIMRESDVYCIL